MVSSRYLFLVLIAIFNHGHLVFPQIQVGLSEPSEQCLDCICYASTGCNRTFQCDGDWCGMFRIGEGFWEDGGSITVDGDLSDKLAWRKCALDPVCARNTVRNYMKMGRQDCNKDDRIDCVDFAWIHNLGRWGCKNKAGLSKRFMSAFQTCLLSVIPSPLFATSFGAHEIDNKAAGVRKSRSIS